MSKDVLLLNLVAVSLLVSGCDTPQAEAPPVVDALNGIRDVRIADIAAKKRAAASRATEQKVLLTEGTFEVEFETTCGNFTLEVHREWAPHGAERFHHLINERFYNGAAFYRVVKKFMVQWGLAADPSRTSNWRSSIPDDPVVKSNTRGYVSFAKGGEPNSRSTQVFINYVDNSNLHDMHFAPFAIVTKGMEIVDRINGVHGEKPDQGLLRIRGNEYLKSQFPDLDYIISARFVEAPDKSEADKIAPSK